MEKSEKKKLFPASRTRSPAPRPSTFLWKGYFMMRPVFEESLQLRDPEIIFSYEIFNLNKRTYLRYKKRFLNMC